jgi:twitching motility protein PilT
VVSQTLIPVVEGTGRVAAYEIMISTAAIRNLIRENKVHQMPSVIQTASREGMQSLDQCLKNLVKTRRISQEEALSRASEKQAFMQGVPPDAKVAPAGVRM